MSLTQFWKTWVFDSGQAPIEWKTHPHRAFKVVARFAAAFLGSIAPFSLSLLRSGLPSQLDKGGMQTGWVFGVTVLAIVAIWLVSVIGATISEEKTLMKHVFIGSVAPANLTILFLYAQNIE